MKWPRCNRCAKFCKAARSDGDAVAGDGTVTLDEVLLRLLLPLVAPRRLRLPPRRNLANETLLRRREDEEAALRLPTALPPVSTTAGISWRRWPFFLHVHDTHAR